MRPGGVLRLLAARPRLAGWLLSPATILAAAILTVSPVAAIPKFNTPNSVDIHGNTCPMPDRQGLECPILCVKSFDSCPTLISAPACRNGKLLCDDGDCHDSCDGVANPCLCGFDPTDLSTTYVACPSYSRTVTAKQYDVSIKNQQVELACGIKFGILPANATVESEFDLVPEWSRGTTSDMVWLQCPTPLNKNLSFTEPIFLAFYSIVGGEFVLLVLWHLYKSSHERGVTSLRQACHQLPTEAQAPTAAASPDRPIILRGYRSDPFGLFMLSTIILITIGWLCLLAVFVADHYGGITDKEGGLFLSHQNSASIYIVVWVMTALWFAFVELARFRIVSYFRIECDPRHGQYIQVREHLEDVILMQNESRFLAAVRRINRWVARVAGFDKSITTTPVVDIRPPGPKMDDLGIRYFEYRCTRYTFDQKDARFKVMPIALDLPHSELLKLAPGLDSTEARRRMNQVGENFIRVHVPSFPRALLGEFTHYTYLYQLLALWIWFYFDYYQMGCVQVGVITISALVRTVVRLSSELRVKSLAERSSTYYVRRDGRWVKLDTKELVPGDIVAISSGMELMCDGIILTGEIVVDESSLTGEAMPIRKFAIRGDGAVYNKTTDKMNTVFAGTHVLQALDASNAQKEGEGMTKMSSMSIILSSSSLSGCSTKSIARDTVVGDLEWDSPHTTVGSRQDPTTLMLVTATRASTDKGRMIQRILFPAKYSFVFDEHLRVSYLFIGAWGIIAFGLSIWLLGRNINSVYYGLFVMSEILSPLLPASLVIGQSVTAWRLHRKKLFCIDLPRIMMAGKVRIFCFDKTGTLTKEGLEFFGLHPLASVFGAGGAPQFAPARLNTAAAGPYLLQAALATCHAVTTVGDQHVGNPVDVEQFHASGWRLADKQQPDCHARSPPLPYTCLDTLIAPHSDGEKPRALHVVKRFEFAHARQSMSVATLDPATNHVHMFIKGSFERIKQVSDPHSIPADFDAVTSSWAKEGCYVLAIAHKDLGPVQDWDKLEATGRDEFESGCSFVSLLLFRNQLKEDTADALAELRGGDIRTVMITGDNALTGVYVAKQCGMAPADTSVILGDLERLPRGEKASADASIVWCDTATDAIVPDIDVLLSQQGDRFGAKPGADEAMPAVELAVTAAAFERLVETGRIRDYLLDIRIFARMAPADKVQAVQLFMERGVTGMCGDGGNDCGALRAAHVGIALSEAEASIVSPFSTPIRTVYSCVNLVRQGRCAITTSFTTFKFLIMYGETMAWLQLFSFYFSVVITQPTWIFIDAFVTVGMTLTLSMARPARRLAPSRPTAKLLGSQTLASLVGQVIINFVFLVGMMGILFRQSWYRCHEFDSRDIDLAKWQLLGDNYEAEVIEVLMLFQMVNAAGTFNFGHLYRQSWWRNYAFIIIFCLYLALVSAMGLTNPNRLNCLFRINCGDPNVLVRMGYPRPTWHITPYNSPIGNNVMPMRFRWLLWGYSIANAAAVYIYEFFVVLGPVGQWVKRRWRQHFGSDGLQVKL